MTAVTADTITTNKPSAQTFSNATGTPVVAGELVYYDLTEPEIMYLENSSVRSGKLFSASSVITGSDSKATARITSVDNINLSYVQPFIQRVNNIKTRTDLSGTFIPPANVGTTYNMPMKFNDNNNFNKGGVLLYSKSNNVSGSLKFEIKVNMENGGNLVSSPFIDIETSKLLAYKYDITNTPGETANFISKVVELAEDFDAEDFNLILSAYRPIGTDIKTYIRAQNTFDVQSFDELQWIELEKFEGIETFSSSLNLDDYREFRYRISDANKDGSGVFRYTARGGAGATYKTFRRFAVRIELLSPNIYNVPIVKDYRGIALT